MAQPVRWADRQACGELWAQFLKSIYRVLDDVSFSKCSSTVMISSSQAGCCALVSVDVTLMLLAVRACSCIADIQGERSDLL